MKIGYFIVDRPKLVLFIFTLPVLLAIAFLPDLVKDLRSDAFLADDNPALVYKRKVKEQFGLSDPMVVALVDKSPMGVFNAPTLSLIQLLTDEINDLPNINASRVISLATEKNITATGDGLEIAPFLEEIPQSPEELTALRQSVFDFPLYLGNLVSRDGEVTLIVAEMIDENRAGESYTRISQIVDQVKAPPGVELHIAGEGAIIGYLGGYVDADVRQLIPFCALVITLVLVVAYHGILPALFTNLIVIATLVITMGTMAAAAVPFYVISNALPVILIGIAVADSIHIYLHYFDLQHQNPDKDVRSLVLETLSAMWRPVTLTSLTTASGFLGLFFSAYMPPFKYFGLFAAVGVMVAWFYSLTVLPAVMVITRTKASQRYAKKSQSQGPGVDRRFLVWVGVKTFNNARILVVIYLALAVSGLYAASHLVVDENPINVFNPGEPIVQADKIINRHLNGVNTLDIVVETPAAEDLFQPENLVKIEALQNYVATLPEVGGSVSIVDYLKQMNRSLNNGAVEEYRLPDRRETVAQYFLIYSAMSDPTDFEEEVDYDYRTANVRVYVKSGDYQDVKIIVEALLPYIEEEFNGPNIKASLSGRVNVHYRWISELARSHFMGLGVAVLLVLTVSSLLFRSLVAGILTLLPVASAVLLVYAVMAVSGITLGMGTSMFAAVAVGLGIDYSIHTLERMRTIYNQVGCDMDLTFREFYPSTGRALLFNFMAISGGFGVLTVSKVTSLNLFGAIVVLAVSTSFIASMTMLPALLKVFVPKFMRQSPRKVTPIAPPGVSAVLLGLLVVAMAHYSPDVEAEEQRLSAEEIVDLINAVPEGDHVTRQIEMLMTDRRGKQRSRSTVHFRKTYEDQKRTVLFYLEPANVRDTGFLIWDYTDSDKDDDQWLYLPALRKVRRISTSDRGDYFLGTDFTYEDIKLDGKLEPLDYDFFVLGVEAGGGVESYNLEARAKNEEIAKELGYSRKRFWVNSDSWVIQQVKFWDLKDQLLKTLTVSDVRKVDDIWTRHVMRIENHQTGHRTEFVISNVDYTTELKDDLFTKRALERGI